MTDLQPLDDRRHRIELALWALGVGVACVYLFVIGL